jgi:hypothetical protein
MKMKGSLLLIAMAIVCETLVLSSSVMAQPVVNIDRRRHGNLATAQAAIVNAYRRIDAAQRANSNQLGGHAQRAKDLLIQADAELRRAADFANRR